MTGVPDRLRLRDAGIRLDSMPATGRELRLAVGEEERTALAEILGVTAIERLDAALHAVRFRGGMRVSGRLTAAVVQPSVVTLEPVRQEIDEPVDRVFLPGSGRPAAARTGTEILVDLEDDELPDHFEGLEADMSDLVIETLALAIDPYPRAGGETLADLGLPTAEAEPSPFARLKSLQKPDDED